MSLRNILKKNEQVVFLYDSLRDFYYKNLISDEKLIRKKFKKRQGREVELNNPVNFNDKLQWLKLNWYDPLAVQCADKYEVRKFVEKRIGSSYLNEVHGVYESVKEITVDNLPKSFVLKGTHGSGFNIICKDKDKLEWKTVTKTMKRWLKSNYYWRNREWVYKDIKPRIICEKYLTEGSEMLTDYKFFCFNGEVKYCQVIRGRGENETIDFYDTYWNHMSFTGLRTLPNSRKAYERPLKYREMLELASQLSTNFPFVRVDFYYVNEQIIFGELTFFPTSGMGSFKPNEWNEKIGKMLLIDDLKNKKKSNK
ncbi:ATP-grasp fold amidoligase family protein [Alkalihalophilus marmarensis]|uniref:ATP-grasp fold amidoligase family protein n=1 Tax=Alkalihalophilus marmarensis TaxID=521377 RepID=UPI002DB8C8E4|nr:ATP-grasp fold amidoligase family protein [Alkalihalophilus marmarensis]MEC2073410.1 ATP-grasp fold amidoligase family protein [Alkalihalophilus marmarensis]